MVEDLRRKLDEKSQYTSFLEKKIEIFSLLFNNINIEIKTVNDSLSLLLIENNLIRESNSDLNNNFTNFNSSSEILFSVLKAGCSEIDNLFEDLKQKAESSPNFTSILNQTFLTLNTNLKSLVSNILESSKNLSEPKDDKNRKELQKYINNILENKNTQNEINNLKAKHASLETLLNEKEKLLALRNDKIFSLHRKISTSPLIPYILTEKKLFEKTIDAHLCICGTCGSEISKAENQNEKGDEHMITDENQNSNITNSGKTNENLTLLQNENESLRGKIRELNEINEKLSLEINSFSEQKLITSKPFLAIVTQAEQMLLQMESLKDANIDLQKKNYDLIKEKDNEIRLLKSKKDESREELEKRLEEAYIQLERLKITNKDLELKVSSLEQTLNVKLENDANVIQVISDTFEKQKEKLAKENELIKQQKSEYSKKYEEEFERNEVLNRAIVKLKEEIFVLTSKIGKYEQPGKEEMKLDKYEDLKRSYKKHKERLIHLEEKFNILKLDLKSEKENSEKLISELEVNEKGLDDLNKKLKAMAAQLQENNEKMGKITNEKMKDLNTFKALNEQKEETLKRTKELEHAIENFKDFNKIQENEINLLKETISKYDQEVKFLQEELENQRKENVKMSKFNEQNTDSNNKNLALIKELSDKSAKIQSNYDIIKVKYDELNNFKNKNSKFANNDEINLIQLENTKLKVIYIYLYLGKIEMQSL